MNGLSFLLHLAVHLFFMSDSCGLWCRSTISNRVSFYIYLQTIKVWQMRGKQRRRTDSRTRRKRDFPSHQEGRKSKVFSINQRLISLSFFHLSVCGWFDISSALNAIFFSLSSFINPSLTSSSGSGGYGGGNETDLVTDRRLKWTTIIIIPPSTIAAKSCHSFMATFGTECRGELKESPKVHCESHLTIGRGVRRRFSFIHSRYYDHQRNTLPLFFFRVSLILLTCPISLFVQHGHWWLNSQRGKEQKQQQMVRQFPSDHGSMITVRSSSFSSCA